MDVLCAQVTFESSKVVKTGMRYRFLNTYVDCISLDAVEAEVLDAIEQRQKKHLVFVNALKTFEIERDPRMAEALEGADYILADGVPVLWASRMLGRPLPGRVNGTDLFERLLLRAEERGKSVFLLGARQENLDALVEALKKRLPTLKIAGTRNGYFSDMEDDEVIDLINQSNADILFLGFSSPKKELWAYKNKGKITVPIIQGVGGSFDVVAGIIPRAPRWMQRWGLEWLDRVIKEPRRMFFRYLRSNTSFVLLVARCWFRERFSKITV